MGMLVEVGVPLRVFYSTVHLILKDLGGLSGVASVGFRNPPVTSPVLGLQGMLSQLSLFVL